MTTYFRRQHLFFLFSYIIILGLFSSLAFAHGMSEEEKQAVIEGGNLRYMWLGATHMLSGYDHLAFVFGIVFFLTTFKDIVKYITAFTLGHSVTLIFATFYAIQLNYFLIDAIIGLSVSYIAFANIDGFRKYLRVNPPNMMFMIIGLGLIHGFGLSTRLQELPLSEDQLLLNIISFNLGIEFGQISALAVMLILLATWRKNNFFQTFSLITNYTLIMVGAYLFLMQMHGYEHTANSEEYIIDKPDVDQNISLQSDEIQWTDTLTITIPARGDKEYKIFASQGETFSYSWQTDGESLFFDFHGEPAGDTSGFFQSFEKNTSDQSTGSLTTRFGGTHGWYWKNTTSSPVEVILNLSGQYQLDTTSSPTPAEAETYLHETLD